jgi:hypothetical protein
MLGHLGEQPNGAGVASSSKRHHHFTAVSVISEISER